MDNLNLLNGIYLIHDIMAENANSQSSRHGSGYLSFDYKRLKALFQKITNLIIDYIDKAPLLDMPETAPRTDGTTHGSRGINPS